MPFSRKSSIRIIFSVGMNGFLQLCFDLLGALLIAFQKVKDDSVWSFLDLMSVIKINISPRCIKTFYPQLKASLAVSAVAGAWGSLQTVK